MPARLANVADVVDAATRSRMMAGIRGKNTMPEIAVRKALHHDGFRFRLHSSKLPGRPDIVLPRYHAAVFVNGCFWHGHVGCPYFRVPATRTDFWVDKITGNRERDELKRAALEATGWRTVVVWECAVRHDLDEAVDELETWIRTPDAASLEIAWEQTRD